MGKTVQVKPGFTDVPLPPSGRPFNAGQSTTLTDAEYAALTAATTRAITITGTPADPTRGPANNPVSIQDALTQAEAYSDSEQGNLNGAVTTTAPSAGGAAALPATPTGYLSVLINGTSRKVPYY